MNDSKSKKNKKTKSIIRSFYLAFKNFGTSLPTIIGVILILGIFRTFVSSQMISSVFAGGLLGDTIIGSLIGSISVGNPITSYIIGGGLLLEGVSLFAVTAFIVAWVTVGVIQFTAEAVLLGRQFAFIRNIVSFVLALVVSIATVTTLMVIS